MNAAQIWDVSWYEERDIPGILALNWAEYGEVMLSHESFFDWLQQNPKGQPIFPVAREKPSGKVVGFGPMIPIALCASGIEHPVITGYNIVVAAEYRRQGVFTAMVTAATEEAQKQGYHFLYVFPNPLSLKGALKLGFQMISEVPLLVRPLDMTALAERYVEKPWMRWILRLGWKVARNTRWREPKPPGDGLRIVEDGELDDEYDLFWQQVKTKYELMLVRNRAFLQWRFLDIPIRTYEVLSARQGDEIAGYIVLRQTDVRGTKTGLIADFLVVPGTRGERAGLHLLHEAARRFKGGQLALSGALMLPHTQEYAILQKAGYLRAPRPFAPQSFFLVIDPFSDRTPQSLLRQPGSWFVTIADHDAA